MAVKAVGAEARGLAGVFGSSINPLQVLMQQQATNQRRKDVLDAEMRKRTDELLDYNDKFRPETKFDDMNYVLASEAKKVGDYTLDVLNKTNNPAIAQREASNKQRQVLALKSEMDGWKADIDDLDKTIGELQEKGIVNQNAKSAVRYGWRNPDGSMKSVPEVRTWAANMENILNDPTIYDPKGTTKNWVSGLQDQARAVYSKTGGGFGYTPDDVEDTLTSKIKYERDSNGKLRLGKDLNPIPIIDETTFSLAKQDPYMKTVLNAYSEDENAQMDYLKSLIVPGADIKGQNRQITRGHNIDKKDQWSMYGGYSPESNGPLDIVYKRIEEVKNNPKPEQLAMFNPTTSENGYLFVDANKRPIAYERDGKFFDDKNKEVGRPAALREVYKGQRDMSAFIAKAAEINNSDLSEADKDAQKAAALTETLANTPNAKFEDHQLNDEKQLHDILGKAFDSKPDWRRGYTTYYDEQLKKKPKPKTGEAGIKWK